ncbi:hypothetical protein GCM10023081_41950 [Arthrobacter ginkgonis]|uniref:Isochorismatase-like domain-containing protein n=1 Tax=Arthrobacter ginkgonis TaxID=1630594 RepID=A0ABP7D5D3_9MICC
MSNEIETQLNELLEKAFAIGAEEYAERGFKRRVGYGTRPALIHIDMANAWTRPGHQFSCKNMETIIPACQSLNEAARAKGVPVIYTTTAYDITGVTAAGCVRHTVEDAIAEGFRPIVVREAVGDRVPGVVAWNLFDIDAKFGDVEQLENVVAYLNALPDFSETVPTSQVPVGKSSLV